jgi:hypothetical protein
MIMADIIMRQISPTPVPLPLFKPMAQSWRGVTQVMEVQRLLVTVIPRFIHLHMPAVIDPSALRAAKANAFE